MGDPRSNSPDPRDDAQRELRRALARNEVDAVRWLVYSGVLDPLDEESFDVVRRGATAGDLRAMRAHFLNPALHNLRAAAAGDRAAARELSISSELAWLDLVVPTRDFKQLERRLRGDDLQWLAERYPQWDLEPLLASAPRTPAALRPPLRRVAELRAAVDAPPVAEPAPAARFTDDLSDVGTEFFGDGTGIGPLPPRLTPFDDDRRTPLAWQRVVVPILVVVLLGWIVYLVQRDRHDRAETESSVKAIQTTLPPGATTRVIPTPTTLAAAPTSLATTTTARPATTTAPTTTVPPVPAADVVYFAANSSTVGRDYDELLNAVAARLRADRTLVVDLVGYSDASGSVTANRAVSLRRAQSVRDALTTRGITTFGDTQGAGPDASVDAAKARRVDVIYRRI